MRKLFLLLTLTMYTYVSAQNTSIEGIWKNHEGEILNMKFSTFERITPSGNVTGTWEWETEKSIRVKRATGEEYVLPLCITGTTWAISRPFSNKSWLFYKLQ